jgi:hypothetical protein
MRANNEFYELHEKFKKAATSKQLRSSFDELEAFLEPFALPNNCWSDHRRNWSIL